MLILKYILHKLLQKDLVLEIKSLLNPLLT